MSWSDAMVRTPAFDNRSSVPRPRAIRALTPGAGLAPMAKLKPQHRRPLASTWIGPTAHVTTYPGPAQRRRIRQLFGPGRQRRMADRILVRARRTRRRAEGFRRLAPGHPRPLHQLRQPVPLGALRARCARSLVQGQVTLVGDACHSMTPYLGHGREPDHGGRLRARAQSRESLDDVEGALKRYDAARIVRANRTKAKVPGDASVFHHPHYRKARRLGPTSRGNGPRKPCGSATTGCSPTMLRRWRSEL